MTESTERRAEAAARRFPPYPKYKESGVEWLGEIPEHWDVERLKYLATLNDEALPESTDPSLEMTYVDIGSVDAVAGITETQAVAFEKAPSRARRVVQGGDVIVSTVRTYLRAIAAIGAPESNLIVSTGFAVLRPRRLESSFASHALRAPHFVERVVANSVGVSYPAINTSSLGCFPIPRPGAMEQRAIAAFLDRETANIDALVARKERLIELLQEKRKALITRAVTRGLPPDAARLAGLAPYPRLKPSGIDWLGDVPQDWRIARIGREITLQRGVDITKEEQQEGDVPVISSGGISSYHDVALTAAPGVVVGRKGTAGAVHYITVDFWPHDTTLYVKNFCGNHPRYVYFKLMSMDLASLDTGSANPTLNRNLVHPLVVSWPPVPEQSAIAAFLDHETASIDALIGKIHQAIDHLREFRTCLISAAVTGKIDVRTASREAATAERDTP